MRQIILQAILIGTTVSAGFGQTDWRQELARDYAKVQGDKLVIDDYSLVKLAIDGYEPTQFQVKVHSEAPSGGLISRDQFVAMTSSFATLILVNSLSEAIAVPASEFLQGFSSQTLTTPIGTADLELNFFMTNDGVQVEVVDTSTDTRNRVVWTWAEVLGS